MSVFRYCLAFFCAAVLCAAMHAQDANTVHIRLLDGKTGLTIHADNYMVRVDGEETVHNEWVHINDDGTVDVTLPPNVEQIAVAATYNMSMDTYINCAIAKESDKERNVWYPIAKILQSGLVAPNECSKTHYTAKPGEFVFFVRKRSWREPEE